MDANLKAKWVAALRSGEYQQGKLVLRSSDNEYCCLGVLLSITGATWEHDGNCYAAVDDIHRHVDSFPSSGTLSDEFIASVGLPSPDAAELIAMNDDGKTFLEIADYIEANIPATEVVS